METDYLSVLAFISDESSSAFGVIDGSPITLLETLTEVISLLTFMSDAPVSAFGAINNSPVTLLESF